MENFINNAKNLYSTSKNKGYVVYNKHVAFWGSELSNFFPCLFVLDGKTWKSSEQYFMAKKAEFFNDLEIYDQIIMSMTPSEAKKLGRKIKNFNENKWSKVREKIMFNGVYAKFSQNTNLRNFLFSKEFDNKKFVEGSPEDKIWGVGIIYSSPTVDDEKNWNGLNLLGKTLDKVKQQLSEETIG